MPSAVELGEGLRTAVFMRVERQGRRIKGVTPVALFSHCKHRSMYVTHTIIPNISHSNTSNETVSKFNNGIYTTFTHNKLAHF